ncbi:MAG TPA: putative lipid II flippase FtsW [Steroidobacteraceae bacterium]|nr:putative lipid II flippase FtsW [Steroidobacteraceae bacterium]
MSAAAIAMRPAARGRLQLDLVVVGLVAALLLLGLVMVTSASVTIAARDGNPFFFAERQLLFALVGLGCGAVALRIPTAAWERLSLVLLAASIVMLVLVLVPGLSHPVNGSRRWLHVGGINFQASEAARVMLLIYLCSYAVRREEEVRGSILGVLKPLAVLGFAALLLLVEPDFGSGVVLLATGIGVLFLAGMQLRHFLALCAAAPALFALIAIASPYRVQRLIIFLNPWRDPFNGGFQLTQSLIAIGRGEWFGVGLGASIQKLYYLPEAHTDFVFAVLAEELGFAGVALVVALVLALVYRSLVIARGAAEAGLRFQAYLAAAFGIWFGLQAFINIGVNMGILPTKGLTLPLLSYGRSSLVVTLGWIGILLRVHHETQSSRSLALRGGAR